MVVLINVKESIPKEDENINIQSYKHVCNIHWQRLNDVILTYVTSTFKMIAEYAVKTCYISITDLCLSKNHSYNFLITSSQRLVLNQWINANGLMITDLKFS